MKVGTCLPTETGQLDGGTATGAQVVEIARLAEDIGLDSVWLVDHFCYSAAGEMENLGAGPPPELAGVTFGAWECLTTAAGLACATERVQIGTLVANTGYRNPALLARMADTIDELSGGRFITGLGAGDFFTEHLAFGFEWERRISRFEEALQIIRPLLRGETVSFEGEFYRTHDAVLTPKSSRPGGSPIMIGALAGGPRMKRLIATYADQWNCWLASTDSHARAYVQHRDGFTAACEKHGRDPDTLERNVTVRIAPTGTAPPFSGMRPINGSPAQMAEEIGRFERLGVGHLSLWPYPNDAATLKALAPVVEQLRA